MSARLRLRFAARYSRGIVRVSLLVCAALLLATQLAFAQFTQQAKLVGTGATGTVSNEGWSTSLSTDGNTAIAGGPNDNSNTGAVWVFTRTGGMWTQQGNKLVGTLASGAARQGLDVALSGDGSSAIIGGPFDSASTGAAWVFVLSGGMWMQQGGKLVGTGAAG